MFFLLFVIQCLSGDGRFPVTTETGLSAVSAAQDAAAIP